MVITTQQLVAMAAVFAALLPIVGWLLRLEHRLSRTMTFADHDVICDKRSLALGSQLGEIKGLVETHRKDAGAERHEISNKLDALSTRLGKVERTVAVLDERLRLERHEDLSRRNRTQQEGSAE